MYQWQNKVNGKKTADLKQLILAGSSSEAQVSVLHQAERGNVLLTASMNFDLINLPRKCRQDKFD